MMSKRILWAIYLFSTILPFTIIGSIVWFAMEAANGVDGIWQFAFQVPADKMVVGPQFWIGFVVSCVPSGFAIWAILLLRQLVRSYIKGLVLTATCAALLRKSGIAIFTMAALRFLLQPLVTVLMSWSAPPGERVLAIGMESDSLSYFFMGSVLVIIGSAMAEAVRADEENRAFV